MTFDKHVDLLVIGSGAGALTGGARAAQAGAEVLVVEKGRRWGGTSATSGGGIWIAGSHLAAQAGQADDLEDAFRYIRALTDANVEDSLVRAYVDNGHRMLRWATDEAHIQFAALPYPDYYPETPGSRDGFRTHLTGNYFDAREMEPDAFNTMNTASPAASLWGRINWLFHETFIAMFRPKGWWKTVGIMVGRYALDVPQRFRNSSDRRLTMGTAVTGWLRKAFDDAGGTLWLESPMVSLIEEGGRVTGAVVRHEGKDLRIGARRGVLLAAGGFERNAALRQANLPAAHAPIASGGIVQNEGDALIAAQALGADTRNLDAAWWGPMFRVPGEDRSRLATMERALPFSIVVNQKGKRYANEALAYHRFAEAMIAANSAESPTDPSWFVFDARYRFRYPAGAVIPLMPDWMLAPGVREVLRKAPTIAELARQIDIDPAALTETVERFNGFVRAGEDADFGRGKLSYDKLYGDARQQPNPNLGAIEDAPFYALPLHVGDIGTSGGLLTDERGRVKRTDGSVIPGLYAAGNVAASVMGHSYPGAGSTLGPAMTFAYLAAGDALGINEA